MRSLFFFLLISAASLTAQNGPIVTDRPDVTESAETVPLNALQIETGINYEKQNGEENSLSILGSLFRYGLTSWIELRGGTEYLVQNFSSFGDEISQSGIAGAYIGTKLQLNRDEETFPISALIIHINIPAGNRDLSYNRISPEAVLSLSKDLSKRFSIGINTGVHYQTEIKEFIFFGSAALSFELVELLGCFAEYFGSYRGGLNASHNIDAGFTYLLNNDTQLDLSGGLSLTDNGAFFIGAGVSIRFPDM